MKADLKFPQYDSFYSRLSFSCKSGSCSSYAESQCLIRTFVIRFSDVFEREQVSSSCVFFLINDCAPNLTPPR